MLNVKLKLWQKLVNYSLFILAILITVGLPMYILMDKVVIKYWYIKQARYSYITMFIIGVLGISVYLPLKTWYKNKLQALEVANELNAVGMTSPLIKWLLRFLQFAIPLGVVIALVYGLSFIKVPHYKIFVPFVAYFIGGFVVFVFNDYLKIAFLNKNEVEQQVRLDEKKDKYIAKKKIKVRHK